MKQKSFSFFLLRICLIARVFTYNVKRMIKSYYCSIMFLKIIILSKNIFEFGFVCTCILIYFVCVCYIPYSGLRLLRPQLRLRLEIKPQVVIKKAKLIKFSFREDFVLENFHIFFYNSVHKKLLSLA